MKTGDLFDYAESVRLKEAGMTKAATNNPSGLELARTTAIEICPVGEAITADDVFRSMMERGFVKCIGPASGSLFKSGRWAFTGDRVKSMRKTNHARELKVWRRIF